MPNPTTTAEHQLQTKLQLQFNDLTLLSLALTHRSVGSRHNERLEFLGDGILGSVVAQILYTTYPDLDEGALTRLRVTLVRGETLAEIAQELSLGDYLKLGPGELKSGGFNRHSILANALEALIGAIHLDGGDDASTAFIKNVFGDRFLNLDPHSDVRDPKTRLQELLQKDGQPLPNYSVVKVTGSDHARTFTVECSIAALPNVFTGRGKSRKIAEQNAASNAINAVTSQGD